MLMGGSQFLARLRTALVGMGTLGAFAAAATPAWADSHTIEIRAVGQIPPVCTVTRLSSFGEGDFGVGGELTATAGVNCNLGFALKATSENGAVVNSKPAPSGFINVLPYMFSINLPLDQGGVLSAACAAADMKFGQSGCTLAVGNGLSSGGESAIDGTASLKATWTAPAGNPLAGTYSDTITISVAPTS